MATIMDLMSTHLKEVDVDQILEAAILTPTQMIDIVEDLHPGILDMLEDLHLEIGMVRCLVITIKIIIQIRKNQTPREMHAADQETEMETVVTTYHRIHLSGVPETLIF
jgi:hypothetical protein